MGVLFQWYLREAWSIMNMGVNLNDGWGMAPSSIIHGNHYCTGDSGLVVRPYLCMDLT